MVEKEELKKKAQEKYSQVESLNKEFEQVSNQFNLLNSELNESLTLKDSIDKIQEGPGFSQLGPGIFVPSEVTSNNIFLVNVGRKIFVKMNKEEVKKYLEKKSEDFKSVISQVSKRKEELQNEIQKQVLELQKLQIKPQESYQL